jgi:hypothetical protein
MAGGSTEEDGSGLGIIPRAGGYAPRRGGHAKLRPIKGRRGLYGEDYFAELGAGFEVRVGCGGFREREDTIDDGL